VKVKSSETIPAITPIGKVSSRNFKGKVVRFVIRAKKRKPWKKLFFIKDFKKNLQENEAGVLKEAFEWVRLAPSAGNKQPWRLVYLPEDEKVHFFGDRNLSKRMESYRPLHKLDIGIAMLHFELGCETAGISTEWKRQNAKDISISSIPDGYEYFVTWNRLSE
jgi:hypothetical protein